MDLKYLSSNNLVATFKGKKVILNKYHKKLLPIGDNRLLFLSVSEGCCCFDTTTWEFLWLDNVDEKGYFIDHEYIAYHNDIVYCARDSRDFAAIDPTTGAMLWKYYAGAGATTFMSDFSFYNHELAFFIPQKMCLQ